MAFNAAASGNAKRRPTGVPGGGDAYSQTSQKVFTLVQLCSSIEKYTGQLGTASDSNSLRLRLREAEQQCTSGLAEVEVAMRELRVQAMHGDPTFARSVERLTEQLTGVKGKLAGVLQRSARRREEVGPLSGGVADDFEVSVSNPVAIASGVLQQQEVLQDGIRLQRLDDVDAAIAKVRVARQGGQGEMDWVPMERRLHCCCSVRSGGPLLA